MKKATVTISFDEEKLAALVMYLEQKNNKVESELEKALETLYSKNVPAGVRDFIDMKSGAISASPPKARKQRNMPSSAVGAQAPSEANVDTTEQSSCWHTGSKDAL